ncbi:MAG TPA: FAD-dependent monooxygenase [Kofleriaceae bacterium]|jgi:2-polyprenyl-6-methoxyphenol hydroxylase-like FAD-dependent oxidoreductase
MTNHAVVIVGSGPTGMMLAGELALAGVDVAIVERRPTHELIGRRAGGLLARTLELLDQRGIAERFVAEGTRMPVVLFAGTRLDISDFPTRFNFTLGLWQNQIERVLGGWLGELAVPIYRGRDMTGLAQDATGVDVALDDGTALRADYLVGCDGGRSAIRKAAGIDFPGWDPTTSSLIAEVQMATDPPFGIRHDAIGMHALGKLDNGYIRVMVTEPRVDAAGEPTLDDLRERLVAVFGSDFGVHDPISISRFTDMVRQAAAYRDRRVLLAGDAAHVHPPDGGQGLQLGVQDAVNLGWKLARVVNRESADSLLDTYHAERHPIAARALRTAMASVAMRRADPRTKALAEMVTGMVALDEPRKRYAGMLTGLDIHYDLGEGHPLLGRRMPDLELDGSRRVYALLHRARPVVLSFDGAIDHVAHVDAKYDGAWELPVIGAVAAPSAVLIRPDGYVAWVGDGTTRGLDDALARWCA